MNTDSAVAALVTRLLLLAVVTGATGVLIGTLFVPSTMALADVVDTVQRDVLDVPPLPSAAAPPENSFIYAADGSLLAEISFEESRIPVTLDDIPQVAIDAVVATEDADFFTHRGVNIQAIARAAVRNAQAGEIEQGASTITQQYVKNHYLRSTEQTYDRKIREALWAIQLERKVTKHAILEGYLNETYFGNGVYGIGTAARYYFDKDVGELTLSESALLAGLIRSPERNDPVDNPRNAQARRDIVLDQMAINGFVTAEQAAAAKEPTIASMLSLRPPEPPDEPFWVDWVIRLLTSEPAAEGLGTQLDALQAMGESDDERIRSVFQRGLRIHTTLDPQFQAQAQDAIAQFLTDPLHDPMGAIVSVEPGTGAITTMAVGPKGYGDCTDPAEADEDGRLLCDRTKFNPVVPADAGSTRAGRQPGSSFKPFVIAAALEAGIPPGWQIEASGPQDIPSCDNGRPWRVNNSGGDGLRDMYSGVAGSSNVFHAHLIREIGEPPEGPRKVADMARRLGVRRSELPSECSLALGAVEVFPLEMATAYATLANFGEYCAPYAITRIEGPEGDLLYQHQPRCEQVIERDIAERVIDIMKGPVSPGGTAPVANLGAWATRGKTGTTQDYVDAWFVGYVGQLATAAWVGFENGPQVFATAEQARAACGLAADAELPDPPRCAERRYLRNVTVGGERYARVFGGTIPAPMWKAYMERAVEAFEPETFPRPGSMPAATVPDLAAITSVEDAEALVEAAGLNLTVLEVPDYRPPGTFVGQEPPPGTRVPAGRAVILHLSDGTGPAPLVPNVVGLTQSEAQRLLLDAGYDLRIVIREVDDPDQHDLVLAQSPESGAEYPPGEGAVVLLEVGEYRVDDEPSPSPSPSPSPGRDGGDDGGGNGNGGNDGGTGGGNGNGGNDGGNDGDGGG